jgi:hypothetical protein
VKARTRLSRECPRRVKPKGVASGRRANHVFDRQGLSGGSRPRNRGLADRLVALATGFPPCETVCGSMRTETFGYLLRGEDSVG